MTLPAMTRRPRVRDLAPWTLALVAVATDAQASVAYNNLAPGGGDESLDKNFGNISRWGQQFTASSGGSVTNIKLNLYRRDTQTGTFDVQLWSGSGTTPTASLVTLTTLNWADVPLNSGATNTSAFVEVSSFASSYTLTSGTVYWLVISQAADGPSAKRWTVTGSGGQTASFSTFFGTWTNQGTSVNLGAQITVGVVPGTGLAAIGMIGVASRRRRR